MVDAVAARLRLMLVTRALHCHGLLPRSAALVIRALARSTARPFRVEITGAHFGRLMLDLRDPGQIGYFLSGLVREAADIAVVRALLPHINTALDIGAHIGFYTRVLAATSRRVRVYAFEPAPATYAALQANTVDLPTVTTFHAAVGTHAGRALLYRRRASDLCSLFPAGDGSDGIDVALESIDSLRARTSVDRVDFVKCDVEGAEVDVLRGAVTLLRSDQPPLWLIENSAAAWAAHGSGDPRQFVFDRTQVPVHWMYVRRDRHGTRARICPTHVGEWGRLGVPNVWIVPESWRERFHAAVAAAVNGLPPISCRAADACGRASEGTATARAHVL